MWRATILHKQHITIPPKHFRAALPQWRSSWNDLLSLPRAWASPSGSYPLFSFSLQQHKTVDFLKIGLDFENEVDLVSQHSLVSGFFWSYASDLSVHYLIIIKLLYMQSNHNSGSFKKDVILNLKQYN